MQRSLPEASAGLSRLDASLAPPEVAPQWIHRYPGDAPVMADNGGAGWNAPPFGGAIPDDELLEAVDESYRLVVSKLPKKHRPEGWDD